MPKKEPAVTATPEKTEAPASGSGGVDGFFVDAEDGQFDALVDMYHNQANQEPQEQVEEIEESPPEEGEPEPVPEVEDQSKETEAELKEEDLDQEDKTKEKTVPLAALHEEREKRKGLSKELQQRDEQLRQLIEDNKKLYEKLSIPAQEDETSYEAPEISALRREIERLKAIAQKYTATYQEQETRKVRDAYMSDVNRIDQELSKEGFPGFKFSRTAVSERLQDKIAEDPDNRALNSPEGWKIIYKELYPDIANTFGLHAKKAGDEAKIGLKKNAALTGKTGTAPKQGKPDSEKTTEELYKEYIESRRKAGIF